MHEGPPCRKVAETAALTGTMGHAPLSDRRRAGAQAIRIGERAVDVARLLLTVCPPLCRGLRHGRIADQNSVRATGNSKNDLE